MIVLPTPNKIAVRLKEPHDEQRRFINSPAKRIVIRAGRRSGKTSGIAIKAVEEFLSGARVLYAAPVLEQTDVFWSEVKAALGPLVLRGVFAKSETDRTIEKAGTRQRIRAATAWDPDVLRSDYADFLILDEAQLQREEMYTEVALPMCLDRDGSIVLIYTPPSARARSVSRARDPRFMAKLFKFAELDRSGRWQAFSFSSHQNPFISKTALAEISGDMTPLGYKQEILAEDASEVPGAMWNLAMLDKLRVLPYQVPDLERIATGVDPSGSQTTEAGIVSCGRGKAPLNWSHPGLTDADNQAIRKVKHYYVLRDSSLLAPEPRNWAGKAVADYFELKGDVIVGERNYGGDMVEATIRTISENVSYRDAQATRGKVVRAQPIASLYQKGIVHHVGTFPQLEEEMCSYLEGDRSPNRLDGLVWSMTDLMGSGDDLGLLAYLASPEAAQEVARLESVAHPSLSQRVGHIMAQNEQTKPRTDACPQCGSTAIAGSRCNQCGHTWGPKPPVTYGAFGAGHLPAVLQRS